MQALHTGICSPGELRQTEATGLFPNYQPEAFPSIGPLRLLGLLLGSRSPSEGVGTEGTPSSLSAAMTPLAPSQLSIGTQRLPLSLPGATLIRMGRGLSVSVSQCQLPFPVVLWSVGPARAQCVLAGRPYRVKPRPLWGSLERPAGDCAGGNLCFRMVWRERGTFKLQQIVSPAQLRVGVGSAGFPRAGSGERMLPPQS